MSDITKKAIAMSLKHLLLKKRLNKITVSDIAEDCGINRQTFYYHFQDIYDLVEWVCINDAENVLKENRTYDTWQEGFLAVFALAKQDKPFIDNIYHSVKYEALVRYLYKLVYPLLKGVVAEKAEDYIIRDDDIEFIANFYKYAFVGLLLEWIDKGMNGDPEVIVGMVSATVHGTIEQFLRTYGRKK